MAYTTQDIGGFYKKYLGRDLQNEGEAQGWLDNANAEDMIKNSGEAQNFAKTGKADTPWAGGGDPAQSQSQGQIDSFWQGSAGQGGGQRMTPQQIDALFAANPSIKRIGPDKAQLPNGQIVDFVKDYNPETGGEVAWTISGGQPGENGQWAGPTGGGGGGSAAPDGGSAWSGVGNGVIPRADGPGNSAWQALYDQLLQRSHQSLQVDPNDPTIKGQVDPFAAQVERQRRDYVSNAAERMGPLANIQGEARLSAEKAGQTIGGFQATLLGKELDARRQEIQNALTQRQGMLTTEQANALQMELAKINDATQRLGIQTGATTAANQLGFNYAGLDWETSPLNPKNIRNFNSNS